MGRDVTGVAAAVEEEIERASDSKIQPSCAALRQQRGVNAVPSATVATDTTASAAVADTGVGSRSTLVYKCGTGSRSWSVFRTPMQISN
jgi:hypothetical protein